MSASEGISTSEVGGRVTVAIRTRLGTQPAPYGEGSRAGSPRAAHRSRPAGSEKPAMGSHAAAALVAISSLSQPFHGKSLSLTVRRKLAELNPVCESQLMFSTPWENSALKYSRRTV